MAFTVLDLIDTAEMMKGDRQQVGVCGCVCEGDGV